MNLQELLDELAGTMLRDRSALVAGPTDELWSDEVLVRYINDAQRKFARETLILADDADENPSLCSVSLKEDKQLYLLDPCILSITSAKFHTDSKDLARLNHQSLNSDWGIESAMPWLDYGYGPSVESPGRPRGYWTDEATGDGEKSLRIKMKLDRLPTADEEGLKIYMRVRRLPLHDLTLDNMDGCPEIPEEWHLDMLDWAFWRALRNHDVDVEMRAKANDAKESFERVVKEVRRQVHKKMFAPLGWGFGRNGFNWNK